MERFLREILIYEILGAKHRSEVAVGEREGDSGADERDGGDGNVTRPVSSELSLRSERLRSGRPELRPTRDERLRESVDQMFAG